MTKDKDNFINLYDFIDVAKANRKYPANTANNLKSALKIFEKELNQDELKSIRMIEDSVEEIFRSVVMANKQKSIISLNTYKARLIKVIEDYKKYGADPAEMRNWIIRLRQGSGGQTKKSTGVLISKDKTDKENIILSESIHKGVENSHKIEFSLESGDKVVILMPRGINKNDLNTIKAILDSLVK